MAPKTKEPIKGILKRPKSTPTPPPATTTAPKQDARAVALQHAHIFQDRKEIEVQILENITALLDFPLQPARPASDPHPSDAASFQSMIRIFQPTDYDDLIVERNLADNRCGYALCSNQRRRYKGAGIYKLVNQGKKDFDIVETRELEKWCSQECARRALWIKVQLNETAAWERTGMPNIEIELYPEKTKDKESNKPAAGRAGIALAETKSDENVKSEPERLATEMARLQLEQDHKAAKDAAALALERGDDAKAVSTRSAEIVIREKVTTRAEAPSPGDASTRDNAIEGYKAKFGAEAEKDS